MAATAEESRFHRDGFLCPCKASSLTASLPGDSIHVVLGKVGWRSRTHKPRHVLAPQIRGKSFRAHRSRLERYVRRRSKSSADRPSDSEEDRSSGRCSLGCCRQPIAEFLGICHQRARRPNALTGDSHDHPARVDCSDRAQVVHAPREVTRHHLR
jgi:hypothetical protein